MFCVIILVTHPIVLYRDDGSPRFRQQTVKVEVRTDAIVKNSGIFVAWAEPDQKPALFRVLGYPTTILCTVYRKQFYPKPMVPMESRDSEGVPFASLESHPEGCQKVVT